MKIQSRLAAAMTAIVGLLVLSSHAVAGGTAMAVALNDTQVQLTISPPNEPCNGQSAINVSVRRNGNVVESRSFGSAQPGVMTFSQRGNYSFSASWRIYIFDCVKPDPRFATSNSVFVAGSAPPAPPESLVCGSGCEENLPTEYVDTNGSFALSWPAIDNADNYELQISTNGVNYSSTSADPNINLGVNGPYWWRVRSCNPNGCSTTWTDIDKPVRVDNVPPAPGTPTGLTVVHDFETVTVNWASPGGEVDNYMITETYSGGAPTTTTVSASPQTFPVRTEGSYHYSVVACNEGGCSATPAVNQTIADLGCIASFESIEPGGACATIVNANNEAQLAIRIACEYYDDGAAFLGNDDIIKRGLIDRNVPGALDNLIGLDGLPAFNEAALQNAEAYYNCAIATAPPFDEAIAGVINVRRALVEKADLVSDLRTKDSFTAKYSDSVVGADVSGIRLQEEIDILADISANQRVAIDHVFGLYSDPGASGPGAVLRGEYVLDGTPEPQNTIRVLLSAISRLARSEGDMGARRLEKLLYDESLVSGRPAVVEQLEDSSAYIATLLQLIEPFINETTFDLPEVVDPSPTTDELLNNARLAEVSRSLSALNELAGIVRQGLTPYGFVPDFVPFVQSAAQTNNLHTFNLMRDLATGAIANLEDWETTICGSPCLPNGGILGDLQQFAQNEGEYRARLQSLEATYNQRLITLIGDVIVPGGNVAEPDIYTFLFPDVDTDGDDVTERDARRAELALQGYNFGSNNKGQIAEQYLVIANAETRADDTIDQMQDIVLRMEAIEAEARQLAELDASVADDVFQRILSDGSSISVLMRQRASILQAAADRAARARRQGNILGAFAGVVGAIVTGGAGLFIAAAGQLGGALAAASAPGGTDAQTGYIDTQIHNIQTLQRADIVLIDAAQAAESRLIQSGYRIYNLSLSQNNLELNYVVAQRDVDRELSALARQLSEAATLLSDFERTKTLLELNNSQVTIGWDEVDIRDTVNDSLLVADQALRRAKVWTYVALRALDYYANLPPQTDGKPNALLLDLYRELYFARRSDDLTEIVQTMQERATSDFLFTTTTTACGSRTILSVKYDILSSVFYIVDPVTGDVVSLSDSGLFEYISPVDGQRYTDDDAYQALFRDSLQAGISGNFGQRTLELRFSTHLFQPPPQEPGVIGINPFWLQDAKTAKIRGFSNPNCAGTGITAETQGIQLNFTGLNITSTPSPSVRLRQDGNSYLKHTGFTNFDVNSRLINPMENITVYTAYQQILPSWLIGDIDPVAGPPEQAIGSAVQATVFPLLNGTSSGGNNKTLAFSDRAVANDSWRLVISEVDAANAVFFQRLDQMFLAPVNSEDGKYLTDIQLYIGWSFKK